MNEPSNTPPSAPSPAAAAPAAPAASAASPEAGGMRAFHTFLWARGLSVLAANMQVVAVGWQVYAMTGDPFDLGLVGLCQFLPSILLVLVVGHVADRYDRRVIVRVCVAVEALCMLALTHGSVPASLVPGGGWLTPPLIFAIVVAIGAVRAFSQPTNQAIVANLVPRAELPRGMALNMMVNRTAAILGPAAGGFLYVAGPAVAYAIGAALYIVATVLLGLVRMPRIERVAEPVSLRSVFAGLAFIRSRPAMFGAISLDLFAVLLGGATALLPAYAQDVLQTGPWGLGLLRAAPALGSLPAALWLARHPLGGKVGRTMLIAVACFGIATIVFGLSTSFTVSFCALLVLGASDAVSVVIRSTMVQLQTPDDMRGRVSAVNSVFIGSSNELGEFESGVLAALFGTVPAVVMGGVGTLLVVALWTRLFPELARYDRLNH